MIGYGLDPGESWKEYIAHSQSKNGQIVKFEQNFSNLNNIFQIVLSREVCDSLLNEWKLASLCVFVCVSVWVVVHNSDRERQREREG